MSIEINQVTEAKLLLNLHEIAKEIGMDATSAKYYEKMDQLVDEILGKLVDIWEVEEEIS